MLHKITCAVSTNDKFLLKQFKNRLTLSQIKTVDLASPNSKYTYFILEWDDTDILTNSSRAGAKPKKLLYQDEPVTCGVVWNLREQKHLSDANIGVILGVSESTICRRRKKHMSDGNFIENNETIF